MFRSTCADHYFRVFLFVSQWTDGWCLLSLTLDMKQFFLTRLFFKQMKRHALSWLTVNTHSLLEYKQLLSSTKFYCLLNYRLLRGKQSQTRTVSSYSKKRSNCYENWGAFALHLALRGHRKSLAIFRQTSANWSRTWRMPWRCPTEP